MPRTSRHSLPAGLARARWRRLLPGLALLACLLGAARVAAVEFDIPAQSAADALLQFSQQSRCDVLFSYDELHTVQSSTVHGNYAPAAALELLLRGTGFIAQASGPTRFAVTRLPPHPATVEGRILRPDGSPADGAEILALPGGQTTTITNRSGGFTLSGLAPGTYSLQASLTGYVPVRWDGLALAAGETRRLTPQRLQVAGDPLQLEAFVVVDETTARQTPAQRALIPRMAAGNLDLPRSEDDPLPYKIYDRREIARSGVVDLNEFLQRELIDSDASTLPPEQNGGQQSFLAGSSNLNLRGFGSDATIILVNGRRLPESSATTDGYLGAPDVNFIPLSLVEQVEVLPASASALYNGNPVGGVINIVLRPDIDGTELRTTYTNALGGYDAAQSTVSLQHGQTLLDGRLRLRFNATYTQVMPATEAELGYHAAHIGTLVTPNDALYRATPNVRTADGSPLFPGDPSPYTSVAPGADGTGGLGAFDGLEGVRSLGLFDSPGGLAASSASVDYPYGRRQRRQSWFLSGTYDPAPWLQLGVDALYTATTVNRGYDVLVADLALPSASPFNPFGRDVRVSLNETAPLLGEAYSEARLDVFSVTGGALVRLPADWNLTLDAQYARNVANYRGLAGVDDDRWQALVDRGAYNPLRDTQVYGPPAAFYDEALVYYGHRGQFVRLGDFRALDTAVRITNQALMLPTGKSTVAGGFDYRLTQLQDYTQELRYADDSLATPPVTWAGRTLERVSLFGELQAPLLPTRLLPAWLSGIELDLAGRYIAADTSRETNFAPTFGLKVDFAGGWSLRGSATISNRYPTSAMSHRLSTASGGGPGVNYTTIYDPRRDQSYDVIVDEDLNPNVIPEGAVTQSVGLIFRRGDTHRVRASLDFVDTRKENEILFLQTDTILNQEALWPERVTRAPLAPGDAHAAGFIEHITTGLTNVSWRHSQNWNAAVDYTCTRCLGGRLDAYGRLLYFQRYERRLLPTTPLVNELSDPDGNVAGLLPWRANFGAGWTGRRYGFGVDGHYYGDRPLPRAERPGQGSGHVASFTQYDVYLMTDLSRWWPWLDHRGGLTAQLRVNNVFDRAFPRYVYDPSGAGVQAYGDWRGRTWSLSLTAAF